MSPGHDEGRPGKSAQSSSNSSTATVTHTADVIQNRRISAHPRASDRHLALVDDDALHIVLPAHLTWDWPHNLTLPPPERRIVLHCQNVQTWDQYGALEQLAWRFCGRHVQLLGHTGDSVMPGGWVVIFVDLISHYSRALIGPVA